MEWIEFNPKGVDLPKERKFVLVNVIGKNPMMPPIVCVGYLRKWGGGNNFFVTPGLNRKDRKVTHWSDCLGDNFRYLPECKNNEIA